MLALRLVSWKSDAQLVEVEVPRPSFGQVVIRVGGAGLCHSDLHAMRDMDGDQVPWSLPFTLGHENAGWVHELGVGVESLELGQPVAVYGSWGCGTCPRCLVGVETLCENPSAAPAPGGGGGIGMDGGMAEYMLVPSARHLVPLPEGLQPVDAAPLTDAAVTPYRAIRRSLPKLLPGSTALVIGAGGLGHMAVQILKAITAARVIAVDRLDTALQLASSCGADLTLPPGDDCAAAIRSFTNGRGADLVLDFVGSDATLALGAKAASVLGDLTILGVAGGVLPVGFYGVPRELSIQTSSWGSRPELVEVLNLASRGLIKPTITTFSLPESLSAYHQLEAGELVGRGVVIPGWQS